MTGTVYLVGAGPGAPDLVTLRGARLLEQADIVFHDALVHPEIVALAASAEKIPVGKRCGRHSAAQKFINKRLVDAARKHRVVVRLKGGDPMLFGRAQEEIECLAAAGVRYEIVPGVTSALAASADLGTSLTRRGVSRSVSLVTPRTGEGEDPGNWVRAALAADTTAIYMGVGEAASISSALIAAGKPAATPVVILENASLPDSRCVAGTLGDLPRIAAQGFAGPALILLGDVYRELVSATAVQARKAAGF
ncbi:MAG: uroporphyrinogen-III C-methyltransferase [Proteobacteria bacterium]|nr:uroporphyrinogen-III C-methyltransferase [Pseudomonadota bacterium]